MIESTDNPWDTEQGRLAQVERFRRLAEGDGALADFAKDVVSGRAAPRDLLSSTVLDERILTKLHAAVDQWNALPESTRERLVADSDTTTRERIAELAESAIAQQEPRRLRSEPPDDEPGEVPVILL